MTALADQSDTQAKIEASLKDTLDKIKGKNNPIKTETIEQINISKTVSQIAMTNTET